MSNLTRRNFIKQKLIGGLLCSYGVPFLLPTYDFSALIEKFEAYQDIDWGKVRRQFLLSNSKYYMNTAGLGPSPKVVINQICKTLEDLETAGDHGHSRTEATHQKIGEFLHTTPDQIAITRNATEGINIVTRSLPLKAGDEILLTKHEHIGGSAPWLALAKDIGVEIKLIDLDLTGERNLQIINDNLTDKTKVVSVSHVTCTTGLRLPVKEIVALCRDKGIYSCIDGAQAVGMFPIDLTDINPDFYACSGHKWLFGPKGTGILYINKSVIEKCMPVFVGAYTDSKFDLNTLTLEYKTTAQREEYGTRNTPITLGLGSAIDFVSSIGMEVIEARGRELVNYFRKGLSLYPTIEILTPENPAYSGSIVTIRIKDKDNRAITQKLRDEKHLYVRWIYENDINGIRISFAIFNSIKDVDYLLDALKELTAE